MTDFLKLYDSYLEKILYAVENYSGRHNINQEKAEEWINKQPFPKAKEAAKNIIKHTKYLTLKDAYENIKSLVINQYKQLVDNATDKKIVMIVGKPTKSFYFISVLAVYFMKEYNIRLPDEFHNSFNSFFENRTDIIVNFDDISYSGSQLSDMFKTSINYNSILDLYNYVLNKYTETQIANVEINNILNKVTTLLEKKRYGSFSSTVHYVNLLQILTLLKLDKENIYRDLLELWKNIQFPNIHIFLLGLNDKSLNALTTFKKDYSIFFCLGTPLGTDFIFNYNPFKIHYYEKIPLIETLVSEEELFNIVYYFSFQCCPFVFVYSDFKIADPVSTIANVYNYGPIVPNNFNLISYFPEIITKSYKNIEFNKSNVKERYNYLIHKYYDKLKDPIDKTNIQYEYNTTKIEFCPFINNCYQVYNIINDKRMNDVNYLLFNYPDISFDNAKFEEIVEVYDNIIGNKEDYEFFDDLTDYLLYFIKKQYIQEYENLSKSKEEIMKMFKDKIMETYNFLELIQEQKCGLSFYKNDDYKINYIENQSANIKGGNSHSKKRIKKTINKYTNKNKKTIKKMKTKKRKSI
jgi:hypothetical protein